jgi:hypothetical protein
MIRSRPPQSNHGATEYRQFGRNPQRLVNKYRSRRRQRRFRQSSGKISLDKSILDFELSPIDGHMATLTVSTKSSRVRVSATMTAEAIGRQFEVRRRLDIVARLTNERLVSSRQRIFGLTPMVEPPSSPTVRIVTVCAPDPEFCLMKILVTLLTSHRFVFVSRRTMTLFAWHRSMQTDQREARDLVVKRNALPPIDIIMATLATLTQLSFMRIPLLMAGVAGSRQLLPIKIASVTVVAFYLLMCAT